MHDELEKYINNYWEKLIVSVPEDNETHLGMDKPFFAPSAHKVDGFVFQEQFYWDTYFTISPLFNTEHQDIAIGMVENLLNLQQRLGYIPNSNNRYHLGRSQPPLLTAMIFLVHQHNKDDGWLSWAFETAKNEYWNVWLSTEHPQNRNVHSGLSRYYHENQEHRGAEDESGWDYTNRFEDRALDYLPVDLNAFLYIYETDFAEMADILNLSDESRKWEERAEERKEKVSKHMWDEETGLFFDYNFVENKKSSINSLATYSTMFSGLASKEQAARMVENLSIFETDYGLSTTKLSDEPVEGKQWMNPNGWAPLHFLVVNGLSIYGYEDEATEIAQKWVNTVNNKFKQTGKIYEKFNVINPSEPPTSAVYPDQEGFAWTNAVTLYFLKNYIT